MAILVTRHLETEALILILLTVLRAGIPIVTSNGKSRVNMKTRSLEIKEGQLHMRLFTARSYPFIGAILATVLPVLC